MRRSFWDDLLLLGFMLLIAAAAFAQYSPPATPAPYNPISLAEITGTPRAAVHPGQSNYRNLAQNPYLGGVPTGNLNATKIPLSLEDAHVSGQGDFKSVEDRCNA